MRRRSAIVIMLAVVPLVVAAGGRAVAQHQRAAAPVADSISPDFNGDGKSDLAVGVPGEDFLLNPNSGEVDVHYFTGSTADQQINESDLGGTRENDDQLGETLAPGDFDGNGFSDLAIGTPHEDLGSIVDYGFVRIVYGATGGLNKGGHAAQGFSQDTTNIVDQAETGDQFGSALIAGDFNGDGFDDLAVGSSFEDITGAADIGTVQVIYGSAGGLVTTGNQQFFPSSLPLSNVANDRFGFAVAAGDFGSGKQEDLAIGIPLRNIGTASDAGTVGVIYGSATGLVLNGTQQIWTQDSTDVLDVAESGDHFGSRFAVGDFGRNGSQDLAIGVPLEDVGTSAPDAGAINVLYGTNTGLKSTGNQFFVQGGIANAVSETGDQFGFQLAAGNFDGIPKDDLAVTANLEDEGAVVNRGEIDTLYGSSAGLTTTGSERLVPFLAAGDQNGTALAAGRFLGGDTLADLAMASPFSLGADDGQLFAAVGTATGIIFAGGVTVNQTTMGFGAESADHFGAALSRSR